MPDDPVRHWLRWADEVAGRPPAPADGLADRVRRLAARRRRMHAVAGLAATLVACTSVGWFLLIAGPTSTRAPVSPSQTAQQSDDVQALRATLDRLGAEVRWRTDVVQAMTLGQRQTRRLAQLTRAAAGPDPADQIQHEADKAALAILREADRLSREPQRRERAVQRYRDVIRLFPENLWADVARQKLAILNASTRA